MAFTSQLEYAAEAVGIPLLDHLIICGAGTLFQLRERLRTAPTPEGPFDPARKKLRQPAEGLPALFSQSSVLTISAFLTCFKLCEHGNTNSREGARADDQVVELRMAEALPGILFRADDGLAIIERRIDEHRDSGLFSESLDQLPVKRLGVARYRLYPASFIDVNHARYPLTARFVHQKDRFHRGAKERVLEPCVLVFVKNRRRERPEALTMLYPFD